MLSISAFNALLKIIEEPPEHLLFILATTELHKVPATILSRCQRFAFRRISQEDIEARLQYVAYQENIDLDDSAARVLARMADGGMRDGLSLLDQCASATTGELTAERVYACVGIAGEKKCAELMGYIAKQDASSALKLFNKLYADGKDIGALLDELACLTRDLLILKTAPQAGISMLSGVAEDGEATQLAKLFSGGELLRMMNLLEQTMVGFTRSASRRLDAELCLMSLCQPELQLDAESLNSRLTKLEEAISSGNIAVKQNPVEEVPVVVEELIPAPSDEDAPPVIEELPVIDQTETPVGFWSDVVAAVRKELRPPVVGLFSTSENAQIVGELRGNTLVLKCANSFMLDMVNKPDILSLVQRKASGILGKTLTVVAEDGSVKPVNNRGMEQLLDFGRAHSDVIKVKES